MKTHFEAKERAKELAFKHADIGRIARHLEDEQLGGLLDQNELELVVAEVKTIQRMIPTARSNKLIKGVGITAVIMGSVAIWIGAEFYGLTAVILGVVLFLNPSEAKSNI